jgi:hypothetical protein
LGYAEFSSELQTPEKPSPAETYRSSGAALYKVPEKAFKISGTPEKPAFWVFSFWRSVWFRQYQDFAALDIDAILLPVDHKNLIIIRVGKSWNFLR